MLQKPIQYVLRTLAAMAVVVGLLAAPAYAIDGVLGEAQEQGVIGERADGYLGFVVDDGVSDDLKRRVAEVNALRREVYTRKARQTGESLSVIAALAAEFQYSRLEPGDYFMTTTGEWVQKSSD